MIAIRVDANDIVASGHVTRCLTVARAVKKAGGECIFFTVEELCAELIKKAGFSCILLHGRFDRMEEELPEFTEYLKKYEIESLLADSYYVTEEYFKALSGICRITYFDELYFKGFGHCANLINGILTPPSYEGVAANACLGPDYVPLREEFENLPPKEIKKLPEKILLTSGGSDPFHFIKTFLNDFEKAAKWQQTVITAVTGMWNSDKEELLEKYKENTHITVIPQTNDFCKVLSEADLVITAGGMTIYEACACGTPGIVYSMAENQVEQSVEFDAAGYLYYAGDLRNGVSAVSEKIMEALEELKDYEIRLDKSAKMQRLVDGRGAERIAGVLMRG